MTRAALAAMLLASFAGRQERGQLGGLDAPKKARQFVAYVAEQQVLPAGKRGVLELRFQVEGGYHVNSHTPKSELQIPTRVELAGDAGVKVAGAEYPGGKSYRLVGDAGPGGEMLDVYSESFTVKVPVVAASGEHELKGRLTYQACDKAACYPAKTLGLDVVFTAK